MSSTGISSSAKAPSARASRLTDFDCLTDLRAQLAKRCGAGDVPPFAMREEVDAVLAPLLASPLIDRDGMRATDDAELVWCVQAVQRAINVLEGARSALAAESAQRRIHARRGEASVAETLANTTALSSPAARRVEREAEMLNSHRKVAEVLDSGAITADQAALVAAAEVPEEVRNELCSQARQQTGDETRRDVRVAEAAWRRETDAQRRARQRAARTASMWIDSHDGMWHLRAKFDVETGDEINRRWLRRIHERWRLDKDAPESDRPTVPQRGADALASLICAQRPSERGDGSSRAGAGRGCDAPGGPGVADATEPPNDRGHSWVPESATQMIVVAQIDELRHGVAGAGAFTETGTELGAAELRRLACDAHVIPVVMGGPSEVLDVGRAARTIPAAIRRALIARDRGCVWPGCDRAPIHCDGHHLQHWVDGGPTSLDNLALLCHSHHQRLHEFKLELRPPSSGGQQHAGCDGQGSGRRDSQSDERWTVAPATAPPSGATRTPVGDHARQDC